MITFSWQDLVAASPLALMALAVVLFLLLDPFLRRSKTALYWAGAALHAVALALVAIQGTGTAFSGAAISDNLYKIFAWLVLLANGIVLVMWLHDEDTRRSIEPLALTTLASVGAVALALANELMVFLVAFEVIALALYTLAGATQTERSTEASIKYFLLGAFTFSFMALGSAYIFGATGTTNFAAIGERVRLLTEPGRTLVNIGVGLVLVGVAFELMLVPFHLWGPDVVHGGATPASAAIAVTAKLAALALLSRFLWTVVPVLEPQWTVGVGGLAVISLLVGNVGALRQESLKRILAYSSISHGGFLALAVISNVSAAAFYAAAYAIMNLGAFATIVALESRGREDPSLDDLAGLTTHHPWLAAVLGLFAASLAGVPLTAGFMAKVGLFLGLWQKGYVALAVVAALASVIGFYYYFRIVAATFNPSKPGKLWRLPISLWVILALLAVGVLVLGLFPIYPAVALTAR